jgi:CIC family chloride channel protein
LQGILFSDQLLELLLSTKPEEQNCLIKDITQPPNKTIMVNTPMREVMRLMDSLDTRILPVTNEKNIYLGFVTKNSIFNKYRHVLARQGEIF